MARTLLLRRECAPELGHRAQQREQAGGGRGTKQSLGNATAGEIRGLAPERRDLFKDLILLCPLNIVRISE